MPEQLTKHPDVTLKVLRSAGAKCDEGAPQRILTQCPTHRFCKLPGGEICVYGLPEARNMTQISAADWQAVMRSLEGDVDQPRDGALDGLDMLIGGAGVTIGAVVAAVALRVKNRRP